MHFRVENDFWKLFPGAAIGVVLVEGIDNGLDASAQTAILLEQQARETASRLGDADLAIHPDIAPWRAAYATFGVKPNKYRSSIESLLRSARNGNVRSINPLVDLYNIVSLRYVLPCGGEDMAAVQGSIRLTRAQGGEPFVPLGSLDEQPPTPGEVIYRDDAGVICRAWNWREAERTKLTPATTSAFLCLETLPELGYERLRKACDDLGSMIVIYLGGQCSLHILDRENSEISVA